MVRRQVRVPPLDGNGMLQLRGDHSSTLWEPRRSEVVRNLLDSAVRCFATNGYHGTTTRDIAVGVGLSPAALYVHFPYKELVLYEIMRTGHQSALALLRETVDTCIAARMSDRLALLVSRYTAWHAHYCLLARVCQNELSGLSEEHYAETAGLRRQTSEVFRDTIRRGIASGEFAPLDVPRVARAILSLSIDLIRWYRLDGDDTPEQIGEFYANLVLAMVTSERHGQRYGRRLRQRHG